MKTLRQALDRVAELEEIIGLNYLPPDFLGLTYTEGRFLGLLVHRAIVSRHAFMAAIWGGRPESEQPDPKIIEIYVCKLRKKLLPLSIGIRNRNLIGWWIEPQDRARLKESLAKVAA